MWTFLAMVCGFEFAVAAAAAWRLRLFWTRALACVVIVPVASSVLLFCVLEAIDATRFNGLSVVVAFIPGLLASMLGGAAGSRAKAR
jgi:hypothetical protein